jgi:hypothetical protein
MSISPARGGPNGRGGGPEANADEPNKGEPVKMILELPTQMREVQVPFSFTDVPLP